MEKQYICIDLKSFYASVECVELGLDPLETNLVVADRTRTNKTICLAVSPSLKAIGLPGRPRLYEVEQKVKAHNYQRLQKSDHYKFIDKSVNQKQLEDYNYQLDYIVALPRMKYYMKYSAKIYSIYLKYISKDDIHVYSIDEVFIDATPYLKTYGLTAQELAMKLIREVLKQTGITATAGVGTNMYLAKIAMDIVAKKMPADENGVRLASLNEMQYRQQLWDHRPLSDFWRVGKGIEKRLNKYGIYTMGDVALQSLENEELLYKEFGIMAELLIDHSWGYEPTTIKMIKDYHPSSNSLSSSQVLAKPYSYQKAEIIIKEMADNLSLDLVRKGLVTNLIGLHISYDISNMENYDGEVSEDYLGRILPKPLTASQKLDHYTNSNLEIRDILLNIYHHKVNKSLCIRKIGIDGAGLMDEQKADALESFQQMDLFNEKPLRDKKEVKKERAIARTIVDIKNRYGKNSIIKVMDLQKDATTIERNKQVGGHKG